MENASKALIIAGAILLSILLISLGIMIFTQAQGVVNNSGWSQAEIEAFNSKFQKYEGTIKGAMVKSLLNDINVHNADDDMDFDIAVVPQNADGSNHAAVTSASVRTSANYTVTVTAANDHNGMIDTVTIRGQWN